MSLLRSLLFYLKIFLATTRSSVGADVTVINSSFYKHVAPAELSSSNNHPLIDKDLPVANPYIQFIVLLSYKAIHSTTHDSVCCKFVVWFNKLPGSNEVFILIFLPVCFPLYSAGWKEAFFVCTVYYPMPMMNCAAIILMGGRWKNMSGIYMTLRNYGGNACRIFGKTKPF